MVEQTNINNNQNSNHNNSSDTITAAAAKNFQTSSPTTTTTTTTSIIEAKEVTLKTSIQDAFAGAAAGAFAKTAVAPIERVKLLMQLQGSIQISNDFSGGNSSSSGKDMGGKKVTTMNNTTMRSNNPILRNSNQASSAWNVAKSVYHNEGLYAFWRGNTPNVLRQAGGAALNFMLMDWYKQVMAPIMTYTLLLPSNRPQIEREKRRKLISSFLSGGLAGGTATTFLYPIEFLRTRLAMDVGSTVLKNRMYPNGMRDVFVTIWKTDGIRGLYQGYGIALSGVVLYRALHLGGYDACKTELLHRRRKKKEMGIHNEEITLTFGERFIVAQIVSIGAGTVCYPIDSVRRRLMMQAGQPESARLYRNSIHAFKRIGAEEGVRGFYLGIGPNLLRSFGGALLLVAYDAFKMMQ